MRRTIFVQLLRPTSRLIRWGSLVAIVTGSVLVVWNGFHDHGDPRVFHLPTAGGLIAMWVGFQYDDVATPTIEASPVTLLIRRIVRSTVALPAAVAAWVLLAAYGRSGDMMATLAAAFTAQLLVAMAGAAIGIHLLGEGRGGPTALAALLCVFVLVPLALEVPYRVNPSTDTWTHLFGRYLAIGGAALSLFVGLSRDVRRRSRTRRARRTPRSLEAAGEVTG
jgi:hypothetical protein